MPQQRKLPSSQEREPLVLTIPEVSRLLRISRSKVYSLLDSNRPGGIPVKHFGRCVRVSIDDLRRWLARQ